MQAQLWNKITIKYNIKNYDEHSLLKLKKKNKI